MAMFWLVFCMILTSLGLGCIAFGWSVLSDMKSKPKPAEHFPPRDLSKDP